MEQATSQSSLLVALAQLNDTAWANCLLPKLKKNSSAGNFALACKGLRRLCHANQTKLCLDERKCNDSSLSKLLQHFHSCTEVQFTVGRDDGSPGIHLVSVLPELARLTRLSKLLISIAEKEASQLYGMASLLQLVGVQLQQLRCLELTVRSGWADSSWPWEALGSAQQLTRLAVTFLEHATSAASLQHLSALSSLSSLHSLAIDVCQLQKQQDYSFLGTLPGSLTELDLPLVEEHQGVSCFGLCTNLQKLELVVFGFPHLNEAEFAALGRLVQLTYLDLRVDDAGSNPHFLSSLRSLNKLKVLCVDGLSTASLPCLAELSHLTHLLGTWQQSSNEPHVQQHVCHSVVKLAGEGSIPCAAFPYLTSLVYWSPGPVAALTSLAAQCTRLQILFVAAIDSAAPLAQRTAAIGKLASLQHLTSIEFTAQEDAEVAALASVKQLQLLELTLQGSCTAFGLQMLMQLRVLRFVQLQIKNT